MYCTRLAIADGGELSILAPGVTKFGEDAQVDKLIRKYGYRSRLHTLEQFNKPENQDLRDNMGAAGAPDPRLERWPIYHHVCREGNHTAGDCGCWLPTGRL